MSSLYLYDPRAPERIRDYSPDMKLVVSLRDPVERAYSSYLNQRAAGELPKSASFGEAINRFPDLIEKSTYAPGLRRFLDLSHIHI